MKAIKYDSEKPRTDLLPSKALIGISKAMGHGEKKYSKGKLSGAYNYKQGKGLDLTRVYASCLRHLIAWNDGENIDKDSGLPHIYSAGACIVMLIDLVDSNIGKDTRFKVAKD